MISISAEKCIRCHRCVEDCVVKVLHAEPGMPPAVPEADAKFCIKCQHCLAVCPAGAIAVDGVTAEDVAPQGRGPSPEEMENLIRLRRSIRRFKQQNVSPEIMAKLEEMLRFSPTGCNDHRLRFAIVKSREKMDLFRAVLHRKLEFLLKSGILKIFYPRIVRYLDDLDRDLVFRGAPHMIAALTPVDAPCAAVDPVIALEQFELYAQTLGIGCCWCGFAVHAFQFSAEMRKMLQIPRAYRVGYVLLFGYPDVQYARATLPPKPEILDI